MMAAKGLNALRPSRLLLFLFAITLLSVGLGLGESGSPLDWLKVVLPAVVGLRLAVMALSAWLDLGAAKQLDGTLALSEDGLTLTRPDGSAVTHPWSWVLQVLQPEGALVFRVDERGGRAMIILRHRSLRSLGVLDALRALLVQAGKLPS